METKFQTILKEYTTPIEKAMVYYSVLSSLNDFDLQKKEIELLAFVAIRGDIKSLKAREEFCTAFKTTKNMLANLKGRLVKKGLLINEGGKCKVLPIIVLDFNERILLQIILEKNEDRSSDKGDIDTTTTTRGSSREGSEVSMEGSEPGTQGSQSS